MPKLLLFLDRLPPPRPSNTMDVPCKEAFVLACTDHVAVSIVCRWIEKDFLYMGVCRACRYGRVFSFCTTAFVEWGHSMNAVVQKQKKTAIPARLTYSHVEEVFLYPPTYNINCYVIGASQNKRFFTRYFTQYPWCLMGVAAEVGLKIVATWGQQRISLNAWVLHAPSRCFLIVFIHGLLTSCIPSIARVQYLVYNEYIS